MEHTTEEPTAGRVCTVYTVGATVQFFHNSSTKTCLIQFIQTMHNTIY